MIFPAVFTIPRMSSQEFGTAYQNITHCLFVAWEHFTAVSGEIFSAIQMKYISNSSQRSAITLLIRRTGLTRDLLIRLV
jgi:hypothetical protein